MPSDLGPEPKKAKNAYQCFNEEFTKKEHDQEKVKEAGGLFKMAGAAWQAMSEKERAPYEEMKAKDEARHAAQLAERAKKGYFKLEDGTKSTDPANAAKFKAKAKKSKRATDSETEEEDPKPKRAQGAYNYFMAEMTEELMKTKPDIDFGERAKHISAAWKECSEEAKAKYEKMAEPDRARYEK